VVHFSFPLRIHFIYRMEERCKEKENLETKRTNKKENQNQIKSDMVKKKKKSIKMDIIKKKGRKEFAASIFCCCWY